MPPCRAHSPCCGAATQRRSKLRSGSPPSRASLCGAIRMIQTQRDQLREITWRQRNELHTLDQNVTNLRSGVSEAEAARAGYACETYARRCAVDSKLIELRQLETDKTRLEEELANWRSNITRRRDVAELDARHDAERTAWEAEKRFLEHEIANGHAEFILIEERTGRRAADRADAEWHVSTVEKLKDELTQRRRQNAEAERQLQTAQLDLTNIREKQHILSPRAHEKLDAEKARLSDVRQRLARESEERLGHKPDSEVALQELDNLRLELRDVLADNAQLRSGLQQTLRGLDFISRQGAQGNRTAASATPRLH